MTREEMILELLGKCGQDFDEVMSALESERVGLQRREMPRDEIQIPRRADDAEIHFEPSYEVETVEEYCPEHDYRFTFLCDVCLYEIEKANQRVSKYEITKQEIADFTARQKAVGEAILRKLAVG